MKFLKDFGALVAIALAALGGAVTYGGLKSTTAQNAADLATLKPQVQQVQQDNAVLREAVQDIRDTVHRLENK